MGHSVGAFLLRYVCLTLGSQYELVGEALNTRREVVSTRHVVGLRSFMTHAEFDAGFTFESVVLLSDASHVLSCLVNLVMQNRDLHELGVNRIDSPVDVCDLPVQLEEPILLLVLHQVDSGI